MADAALVAFGKGSTCYSTLVREKSPFSRVKSGEIDHSIASTSSKHWIDGSKSSNRCRSQIRKRSQMSKKSDHNVLQSIYNQIHQDTTRGQSWRICCVGQRECYRNGNGKKYDVQVEPAVVDLGERWIAAMKKVRNSYHRGDGKENLHFSGEKMAGEATTIASFRTEWVRLGALAAAGVALNVGLSVSLASPAVADLLSDENMSRTKEFFVGAYDVTRLQQNDQPRSHLLAELEITGATEDAPNFQSSEETHLHMQEDSVELKEARGLNLRQSESSSSALSMGTAVGPGLSEVEARHSYDGSINGAPLDESSKLRIGMVYDQDKSLPRAKPAVLPASCSSSDLVAVAAIGSVASAASVAGKVVTHSAATVHHVAALPGGHLLARALQHLGGGGVAGAVGATVVYPLDTIKTRMQAQSPKDGEEPQYKDELDCFKQLLVHEGPGSLYYGLVPQLLGIAPEKALKLTVNEALLEMLEQLLPGAGLWALEFIAGGGGGFSQVVVTNPMEIVKLRLQMQSKDVSSKGVWQVVRELGLRGLYCGTGITLARDVPSSAIFFACYTLLRQLYPDQSFLAGFLAAIPATVLVTPLDVIKTRLQMETPSEEERYKSAWHCLKLLLQREGPRALFKGGLLRVLRTSPQFGITLMVYTLICSGS